jgi:hypothetical protein
MYAMRRLSTIHSGVKKSSTLLDRLPILGTISLEVERMYKCNIFMKEGFKMQRKAGLFLAYIIMGDGRSLSRLGIISAGRII